MFGTLKPTCTPGFSFGTPQPVRFNTSAPEITNENVPEIAESEKAEKLRRLSLFDIHDLILKVEDTNLYVNKKQLTTESPVFERMLSSPEHNGKDTNELSLEGKDVHTVVEFLRCTLPGTDEDVTDKTVHAILPLAEEYQTQKTKKKADDFLAKKCRLMGKKISSEQTIKNIIQAEKYHLNDFLEESIIIASRKKFDNIVNHPQFEEISKDVRLKIALKRWYEMDFAIGLTEKVRIESQTEDFLKPFKEENKPSVPVLTGTCSSRNCSSGGLSLGATPSRGLFSAKPSSGLSSGGTPVAVREDNLCETLVNFMNGN